MTSRLDKYLLLKGKVTCPYIVDKIKVKVKNKFHSQRVIKCKENKFLKKGIFGSYSFLNLTLNSK